MSGYFDDSGDWVDTSTDTGEDPPPENTSPPGATIPPGEGAGPSGPPGTGFDQPGGTGTNGPPTAADIARLKATGIYTDADIAKILGKVAETHPEWASIAKGLLPSGTSFPTGTTTPPGSTNGPGGIPGAMVPGLINMFQKWNQGKDYSKWADQSAALADPFAGQRGQYQTQLSDLYKDPSTAVNTPGYQFALKQGLGAVANRDNNRFGIGAGSTSKDMMDYASGLASTTFDKERNALMQMAGANTGNPGAAASAFTGMHNAGALSDTGAAGALGNVLSNTNWSGMNLSDIHNFINLPTGSGTPPPTGTTPVDTTVGPPAGPDNLNSQPVPPPEGQTVPNNNTGIIPGGT